jgi:hypothetical protein
LAQTLADTLAWELTDPQRRRGAGLSDEDERALIEAARSSD